MAALLLILSLLGTAQSQARPGSALASKSSDDSWTVVARAAKDRVKQGGRVSFRGHVAPRRQAAGRKVLLQKRYEGRQRWKTHDRGRVRRDGTFKFVDLVSSLNSRSYRVVMPRGAGHRRGVSDRLDVAVYAWRSLLSLEMVAGSTLSETDLLTMNGVKFYNSLRGEDGGSAEYGLGGRCMSLRATYGIVDGSPEGSAVRWEVGADGRGLYSSEHDGKDAVRVRFDLPDPDTLTLRATGLTELADIAGMGTPIILCRK